LRALDAGVWHAGGAVAGLGQAERDVVGQCVGHGFLVFVMNEVRDGERTGRIYITSESENYFNKNKCLKERPGSLRSESLGVVGHVGLALHCLRSG
jgi:hypothetical protein